MNIIDKAKGLLGMKPKPVKEKTREEKLVDEVVKQIEEVADIINK
jgi:hypothetical protein